MNRFKLYSALNFLLFMILVSHSQAVQAERYQMTVLPHEAQGYLVRDGHYEDAISRISPVGNAPFPAYTNLCVAHTMMGHLAKAEANCNRAVDAARLAVKIGKRQNHNYRAELVIALSNRGVQRTRGGNFSSADADFREALAIDSVADLPGRNLSVLSSETAYAVASH